MEHEDEPQRKKQKTMIKKKNRNEWDTECSITNIPFIESMGEEVHIFMHVHMRGYDRTGEGRVKDAGYYDKYGAPATQKDSWMDGYHAIELELAKHFNECASNDKDFPLVAGMAGGAHLYKPMHDNEPWNWTGWVPQRKVWCTVNKFHLNRHFLNIRGNEIQNNLWDVHPFTEKDGALIDDEDYEQVTPLDSFKGKGYWLKDHPNHYWARYIHVIALKSHRETKDKVVGKCNWLRYNYIVHPLAYRRSLNECPDNSVDHVQWANLFINEDKDNFNAQKFGEIGVQGLEIFNDFTYFHSYQPLTDNNSEHNGTVGTTGGVQYIHWFDTYPLEFGEFLLDTSLERGVYMHVLAANDAFYDRNLLPHKYEDITDADAKAKHDGKYQVLLSDPKGGMVKGSLPTQEQAPATFDTKMKKLMARYREGEENLKATIEFFKGRPYTSETAFGHTTLIDTRKELRGEMEDILNNTDPHHPDSFDEMEWKVMEWLREGKFYSHTGVYDLFNYTEYPQQILPFIVMGQTDRKKMCYQVEEGMNAIFDFPRVKEKNKMLVWRYSLQHVKGDGTYETVHGYFRLNVDKPTRVNLSEYNTTLKYVQFTAFKDDNPQRRAWFNAVRGVKFYDARPDETPPSRTHRVVLTDTKSTQNDTMNEVRESDTFEPSVVESGQLKFYMERCSTQEEKNICVYDLQVCAHQQKEKEKADSKTPGTQYSWREEGANGVGGPLITPPRYLQNVHGYFHLNDDFPTKLDLSNSWDPTQVKYTRVSFYAIDTQGTGQPITMTTKPKVSPY